MTTIGWVAAAFWVAGLACAQPDELLKREGNDWIETVSGYVMAGDSAELRMDVRGSVTVKGGGGPQLFYVCRKRVEAPNEAVARRLLAGYQFRTRRMGNTIYLTRKEGPRSLVAVEIEVHAPRVLRQASVETAAGAISLLDLPAEVQAVTGAGPVTADRVAGALDIKTTGGGVTLGAIGGSVRVFTGGGPIRLKKAGGEARLETVGGEIIVEDADGEVYARTGAGNVEVTRSGGAVVAQTHGGLIRVHQARGQVSAENAGGAILVSSAPGVRCESASGGIKLLGVSGELKVVTAMGHILAELMAGKPLGESYLSTSNGDITVMIPSNLAVTVEATNESPGRSGRIISDFAEIRIARPAQGAPQTVASGRLNGGGPLLRIAASDGTIFLRRLPK